MKENFYGYILSSQRRGTLYVGVTSNPAKRVYEHRQIKKWDRAWKLRLIEEHNPEWADLHDGLTM
jgi:putative endonuclease